MINDSVHNKMCFFVRNAPLRIIRHHRRQFRTITKRKVLKYYGVVLYRSTRAKGSKPGCFTSYSMLREIRGID